MVVGRVSARRNEERALKLRCVRTGGPRRTASPADPNTGPVSETGPVLKPSRQFNNLFIAYAKVLNKAYQRTDSFFDTRPPGERG